MQLFFGLGIIDNSQCGRIVHLADQLDLLKLSIVHEAENHQGAGGYDGAKQNERCAAAPLALVLVGQGAEQRQQEQGQNVIQRHDYTGPELIHTKFVGQGQGNGGVVSLPEQANQEKCKTYQDRALIIELHRGSSILFIGG